MLFSATVPVRLNYRYSQLQWCPARADRLLNCGAVGNADDGAALIHGHAGEWSASSGVLTPWQADLMQKDAGNVALFVIEQ